MNTKKQQHTFPQPHYDEGCVKCGGFRGEPYEPPTSKRLRRLYLTKEAGDDLWHWIGHPIRPTATFDVGLVRISRDEIKVDGFGAYVLRETGNAEERKQWRDEIEALVEVAPSGARVVNCYPEQIIAIVENALAERFVLWLLNNNKRKEEMVEPVAKAIYKQMSYCEDGIKPEWVVGGNSLKQDEARRIAQKALAEAQTIIKSTPPIKSDGEVRE